MIRGDGDNFYAEQIEGAIDGTHVHAGEGTCGGSVIENIRELAAYGSLRIFGGVNRNQAALFQIVGANIVQAENVIGVAVSVKNGVESIQFFAQGLEAEVRRSVDDNVVGVIGKQDGGPGALVSRVGGFANSTVAGERGYAHGRAGA